MYNLKLAPYPHQHTWLHTLSPKIKIHSMILWSILSFCCPLTIFWFIPLTLILLNFYLQFFKSNFLLYLFSTLLACFSNPILYTLIPYILLYMIFQLFSFSQTVQIKIDHRYLQHSLLINKNYTQHPTNNTLNKIPVFHLIFKQYIILIGFIYFCQLLETTTYEEELIFAYLSTLVFSKRNHIDTLFFCFSITKQYKHLIIEKITNILYSIKFRDVDSHKSDFIYCIIHLTTFYSEIFINKLLIYSQIISECLYSRELVSKKTVI